MEKEIEIPEGYEARIEGNKVVLKPKESEDKQIIDALTKRIQDMYDNETAIYEGVQVSDILAWLEKQKEQKSINSEKPNEWNEEEFLDETKQGCDSIDIPGSIKTSRIETLKNMISYFKYERKATQEEIRISFIPCLEYLLKDVENTNKPAEWSEEDDAFRDLLICILKTEHPNGIFLMGAKHISALKYDVMPVNRIIDWLKSLRPQSHWKPSDK